MVEICKEPGTCTVQYSIEDNSLLNISPAFDEMDWVADNWNLPGTSIKEYEDNMGSCFWIEFDTAFDAVKLHDAVMKHFEDLFNVIDRVRAEAIKEWKSL